MKKVHRFITDFTSDNGVLKITAKDVVHQISKVLKLRSGEQVVVGKGDGLDVLAKVARTDKEAVYLEPQRSIRNGNEPVRRIVLYCSVLKKENFENAAQKATEVGVSKIVPVLTNRTVKTDINTGRLTKIIKEAAEQSGRGIVPELEKVMTFDEAIKSSQDSGVKIFFDPSGENFSLIGKDTRTASIFIGPEGGWTDEEIGVAKENGFRIISLGPLVMRAETAVAVASYLAIHF
ncbi:MAG TPA: RsmE family RNA methyltransferase [Candidatus Paceibacterota bacterium]|nr:RsmE family RNA methyltransferase [Candidatus Paceibacterota bacterium]